MNTYKRNFIIILTIMITALLSGLKAYEVHTIQELEKVEHEVDTMTSMQGTYEGNGLIVTDDGNMWKITESELEENKQVTVIFQTYGAPVEQWEIVAVTERM